MAQSPQAHRPTQLRWLMQTFDVNPQDLANLLHVHKDTIDKVLERKRTPSPALAIDIATLFGITPSIFWGSRKDALIAVAQSFDHTPIRRRDQPDFDSWFLNYRLEHLSPDEWDTWVHGPNRGNPRRRSHEEHSGTMTILSLKEARAFLNAGILPERSRRVTSLSGACP